MGMDNRGLPLAGIPPGVRRIFITGGPGSGKTTLARRLGASIHAPVYDLDAFLLSVSPGGRSGLAEESVAYGRREALRVAETDAWVVEGVYLDWTAPLLESADVIVWVDVPWRVASYRIIARQVKRELRRNNPFPGWRQFHRFWRWTRGWYRDLNEPGINVWGGPNTRATALELLGRYRGKVLAYDRKG
jgi:shikimate kinase